MELTPVFAIAALLATALPMSCDAQRSVTTSLIANQATGQPDLWSSPSFLCRAEEKPFVRSGNIFSFYKRQAPGASWVPITSGGPPSPRYKLVRITQTVGTVDGFTLTLENFTAADAGDYLCNVTLIDKNNITGIISDQLSVSVATQPATVSVTTTAEAQQDGTYLYETHPVTTTCTVDVVSMSDVSVKVHYNGGDHTGDFLETPTSTWVGSVDGMQEPRRHVTLVSQSFRPVSRASLPVECIAQGQDSNELGRGSINVALKTLPRIECVQSGNPPAYLNDLDVMITCTVHDYDWNPATSHFSWSFTASDGDNMMTVTVDDPKVGKADRRIVEDAKSGKHSLLINKVTSDVARFTVYNIALKEQMDSVTTTTYTLEVLNRSRSSESGSSAARPVAVAAGAVVLSLVALQLLL